MGRSFDIALVWQYLPQLLEYLPLTLLILLGSIVVGCVVGLIMATARLYRWPILGRLGAVYVSFFRGTPVVVQLLLVYFGIPELLQLAGIDVRATTPLVFVIITLGLHNGASLSESFRAAITSVDRGQVEAAYSVGLDARHTFTRIVAPQALRVALPHFSNTVLMALKDTSLAFSIGVLDMVGRGVSIGNVSHHLLEVYLALAIIYYAVSLLLGTALQALEGRLRLPDQAFSVRNASNPT